MALSTELIICWDCAEPIKKIYSMWTEDSISINHYVCGNDLCPRFALPSIAYKTQEVGEKKHG